MKYFNKLLLLVIAGLLSACSSAQKETVNTVPLFKEDFIALQNLNTRVIVYCFTSAYYPADECAKRFEKQGFVRLNDIPKLPAEYDFIKGDTYPTRRWRKDERIPRW